VEILAHRIVWSLVVIAGLLALRGGLARVRAVRGRPLALLVAAAAVITVNWGTYIFGVNSGQVVETSLGYFINPLVTVLLGVVVLGERLRRLQWVAVGIAAVAVAGLTVDYGRVPWIALVLACSFGTYGLLKKQAGVGAVESLAVETAVLAGPALAVLLVLQARGVGQFGHTAPGATALLVGAGIVTVVPLLAFSGAATRIPLSTLGILQYLAPTVQFLIGVLVVGEPMPPTRLLGFALVWVALAVFTADALRTLRAGAAVSRSAPPLPGTGP
jgi:chloramphenicol-sensitive protein RarD